MLLLSNAGFILKTKTGDTWKNLATLIFLASSDALLVS